MMKSHATQYDCVTNSLLDNAMNSVIKPEFKVSVFMPVLCIRVCVCAAQVCVGGYVGGIKNTEFLQRELHAH